MMTAPDNFGKLPLHYAAQYGYSTLVQFFLLRKGVNLNHIDKFGKTYVFHFAHFRIQNKRRFSSVEPSANCRPLVYAVLQGHKTVAEILINGSFGVHAECNTIFSNPEYEQTKAVHGTAVR